MNRTKIEWVRNPDGTTGYTWNPVTGCLGPNNDGTHCPYCYAKRIAERFRGGKAFPNGFAPTWHPERLDEPAKVKTPSRIFVGSMTDMGAPWIEHEWMLDVLSTILECPVNHTFLFLSKQPRGYLPFSWPTNTWLGATVCQETDDNRLYVFDELVDDCARVFASFEPLLGDVVTDAICYLDWAIIGAQTGPGAVAPNRKWIADLLECLNYYRVPIFMKDNLRPYWDGEWRQEWPTPA